LNRPEISTEILQAPPHAFATVLLPEESPPASGKRSTHGWKRKAVLLKEETVAPAQQELKARGEKTDFSDLVQALLDAWVKTPD